MSASRLRSRSDTQLPGRAAKSLLLGSMAVVLLLASFVFARLSEDALALVLFFVSFIGAPVLGLAAMVVGSRARSEGGWLIWSGIVLGGVALAAWVAWIALAWYVLTT